PVRWTKFDVWWMSCVGFLLPLVPPTLYYLLNRSRFRGSGGPIVVRYDPPDGIGPFEGGLILDGVVQPRDFVGGLLSAARKGAFEIRVDDRLGVLIGVKKEHPGMRLTNNESRIHVAVAEFGTEVAAEQLRGEFSAQYAFLSNRLREDLIEKQILSS